MHSSDKTMKVAIVTPTYLRDAFLIQTLQYVLQQSAPWEIHWFILDDSPESSRHADTFGTYPQIHYEWLNEKIPLGKKRNLLNEQAVLWEADIICSMDDDDWYGPDYVKEMTTLLYSSDEILFTGSGDDYYLNISNGDILKIPAVREYTSCNGVLCYKAEALKGRKYSDDAKFAEEHSFLNGVKVYQHPDIQKLHLALAHPNNTVTKKNYCRNETYRTELSLNDFPMQQADRLFYLNLINN